MPDRSGIDPTTHIHTTKSKTIRIIKCHPAATSDTAGVGTGRGGRDASFCLNTSRIMDGFSGDTNRASGTSAPPIDCTIGNAPTVC